MGRPRDAPLNVNDHVLVAPPFKKREGEPYIVARIQEILRARYDDTTGALLSPRRVRVAFYLRMRDITSRYIADHRIVVATMHSDVVPLSYIRARCRVYHREQLPEDLEDYKKSPDSFYFHQLYDRYLHRFFDVIPTDKVQNAPDGVLEFLREKYEYILAEVGLSAALCDVSKGCVACRKFAANNDSVSCASCKQTYHLGCVTPPLLKKPALGYSWHCGLCQAQHEHAVAAVAVGGAVPRTPAVLTPPPSAVAKGKARAREPSSPLTEAVVEVGEDDEVEEPPLRTTNGWPYRYFGQHTDPDKVFDPHDSIYPRASTRVGTRFQCAIVPEVGDKSPAETGPVASTSKGKAKRESKAKSDSVLIARGTAAGVDRSSEAMWLPPEACDDLLARVRALPAALEAGVIMLDAALESLADHHGDVERAFKAVSELSAANLGVPDWSEAEIARLDWGIKHHQDDLEDIAHALPDKSLRNVIHYFYVHRPEADKLVDADKFGLGSGGAPGHIGSNDVPVDEYGSDVEEPHEACAICGVTSARSWHRCPASIGGSRSYNTDKVMCDSCSIRWRHYGNQYAPAPGDEERRSRRRKRLLLAEPFTFQPREETPPPAKIILPPKPCLLCLKMEPEGSLRQCQNCTISGHRSCIGAVDEGIEPDDWLCDMCSFVKERKHAPANPRCCLCPTFTLSPDQAAVTNALDILKPTSSAGWIHLICAVWQHETAFGDPAHLQPVEGAEIVLAARSNMECFICGQTVGACVRCDDCPRTFHIGCAWAANLRFGFEILPVASIQKKRMHLARLTTFAGVTGEMHSKIWCKSHRMRPNRPILFLDAVDPDTGLTALQSFVREYREASLFFGPGSWFNLRESHRVDSFIRPALDPTGQLATFQAPPVEVFEAPKPKKVPQKKRARPTKAQRVRNETRRVKKPGRRSSGRKMRDSPDDEDDVWDPPMNDDDYDDRLPDVAEGTGEADESGAWLESDFIEQPAVEEPPPEPAPPPPPRRESRDYDGPQQLTIEPGRLRRVDDQYAQPPHSFVSEAEPAPSRPAPDPRLPPHLNGMHNGNGAAVWPPMASGSGQGAAPSPPMVVDQWADIDPMFQPADDVVDPALSNGDAMMYEMPEPRTSEPPHSAPILPPHLQQSTWSPPAPDGDMHLDRDMLMPPAPAAPSPLPSSLSLSALLSSPR